MLNRVTWRVENMSVSQVREEAHYLFDQKGVPYYKYPLADTTASFEITGKLDWTGRAWSKEKMDGLIPFLNQKLKEYEDGWTVQSDPSIS